jgi:hypothetical protein
MPSVPIGNQQFLVGASLPGGLNASYYILVKNKTRSLEIDLKNDFIEETNNFNLTVLDEGLPVQGVSVFFNSNVSITNENGEVILSAPDVLYTTNFGISVNKTGYLSNTTTIKVIENGLGLQLMDVIYPFIIEAGTETVEISVFGLDGGLENVSIIIYYEDEKIREYKTNMNGIVDVSPPIINNDNYFSLIISKDRYKRYDDSEIIINFFARDLESDLEISINPTEIYEGNTVTVKISDEFGNGVKDSEIWKGSAKIPDSTDSNGILNFNAPSVFFDKEMYIYALKQGYNFAEGKFTIRNKESYQSELFMNFESFIFEDNTFNVTLFDENNNLIEGVYVTFNSIQKITNDQGMVQFSAPNVTNTTTFLITANKYNFLPISNTIEVINEDKSNGVTSRKIYIYTFPTVLENEEFSVTIRNEFGELLSDVKVTFEERSLYTDFSGTVLFSAPEVSWDRILEIQALKSGYESSVSDITIKNAEDFQYLYLVIIVAIILIVGIFYYFKFRRKI